mgnify:CR=1 FL=1
MQQQVDQGAGTDQAVGGAEVQQQQAAQQQQPAIQWNPPTGSKWAGKSPMDVLKAHEELERKLGSQGDELGKWRQWGQQWDPHLKQIGYNPKTLSEALERASRAASQRGDQQQAQQLHQQAQQAKWSDAITPQEQEQWLQQHMDGRFNSTHQQFGQALQQVMSMGQDYITNYMDLGIKAILAKIENPSLDLNKMLEQANQIASGQYDALEWSKKIMLAESPEAIEARMRKTIEAEMEQKARNQRTTAGVGAVAGGGVSRPLRSSRPAPQQAQAPAPRRDEAAILASAKEQFLGRLAKDHPEAF